MKIDIRRYISLRDSLTNEKAQLEARLQEINAALGQSEASTAPRSNDFVASAATPVSTRGGRRRGKGGLSLREAVLQVTSKGALTKEDILAGVKGLGYRFATKNPLNSLGVILYGKNPKFRNDSGRFSQTGGGTAARQEKVVNAFTRKRRKLSPEARERIAAAQRARWAKAKGK